MNEVEVYGALVVVSFGGPEKAGDVRPFLQNVARGRDIPEERLAEVEAVYLSHGGASPANELNRDLVERLKQALEESGNPMPVYLGNRNWHPYLEDTVGEMAGDGVKRALAFVTAGFSSYSSCRQYREDIEAAVEALPDGEKIEIHKLRGFFNHPDFISIQAEAVRESVKELTSEGFALSAIRIIFTAHSLPMESAKVCSYEAQLRESSRLVMEEIDWSGLAGGESQAPRRQSDVPRGGDDALQGESEMEQEESDTPKEAPHGWDLVWQSRSGPPMVKWLEPDIGDHIPAVAFFGSGPNRAGRCQAIVVVPIGFVSDHMEVIQDLDTVASQVAEDFNLAFRRASTVGSNPRFPQMIASLVAERIDPASQPLAIGTAPPLPDFCPKDCCPRSL